MSERLRVREAARQHISIVAFGVAYLVGFLAYGLLAGSRLTIAYAVTIVVVGLVVARAHATVGFSRGLLWSLAAWGFLHMAGGLIEFTEAVLYNVSWGVPVLRYDRLVHAFGFGATTALCWQVLRRRAGIPTVTTAIAVIVWLGGMGFGAINEVVEFIISRLTQTNVGGFVNTGYDLIFNALGTASVAIWLRVNRTT
ncbi:MAG TPA: DUF2238 domain-containing protein [Actinomycetota bacterium]|jgi:hypothetical protein|nr:DUF2238 domain-containing protein [Actinomycetota bacterium]